jgi:hypothetical protein
MQLTEEQKARRIDGTINILLGYTADKLSTEYCIGLQESYRLLVGTELYERLCDHSTYLYLMDPLELYSLFVEELGSCLIKLQ